MGQNTCFKEAQLSTRKYVESKKKNGTNELIYKTEIESQMLKTNLWLPGGKGGRLPGGKGGEG